MDRKTSARVLRIGDEVNRTQQQPLGNTAGSRFFECLADVRGWPFGIAVEDLAEKRLFVPESGVEAGAVDAHSFGQIGKRRSLVTLAPKDLECASKAWSLSNPRGRPTAIPEPSDILYLSV